MRKVFFLTALIVISSVLTGCEVRVSHDNPLDIQISAPETYEQNLNQGDYEMQQAQMKEEEAARQEEQERLAKLAFQAQYPSSVEQEVLEKLDGSVTFESSVDSSKKYTVSFDAKKFPYLGKMSELWNYGNGYLYGDDSMGADDVIVVTYLDPAEYQLYLQDVEMSGLTPMMIEARGDALMYVYEGNFEGDCYWNVFFHIGTGETMEGILFTNITQKHLSTYGLYDVFDLVSIIGELKISES